MRSPSSQIPTVRPDTARARLRELRRRLREAASPACIVLFFIAVGACRSDPPEAGVQATPISDTAFAALQERGASPHAMGVDQYTSMHRFESLADGGRIELQRDVDDPEGTAQIRTHLRQIARAFAEGNFAIPEFVHAMGEVPGTAVMRKKRGAIRYDFRELPRGGEVRITTGDAEALEAIHRFLAFQRSDHRTHQHPGTP